MKKNYNIIIRIAFTLVIVYFFFNILRIIYDVNEVEKEAEEVSQALEQKEEKVSALKHRYQSPVDKEYLERIARENGYHYDDEIVFYNNYSD